MLKNFPLRLRPRNLNQALSWLLALVTVPLLVGALALLVVQSRGEKIWARNHLNSLAQTLVHAVDGELDYGRAQLEVIAASPMIDAADWRQLYRFGREVASRRPGSLIVLVGPDGQVLLNTALDWGEPLPNLWKLADQGPEAVWEGRRLPLSSQKLTQDVFAHGKVVYSNLYYGLNIQRPTLALSVPVMREGKVLYALTLSFPPALLEELVRSAVKAPGLRATVVDGRGIVVAGNAQAHSQLAEPARPIQISAGSSSGNYEITARDGVPLTGAYAVSPRNGFVARVAMPDTWTFSAARTASSGWILLVIGALLASVLVATYVGRLLARPLRELGLAAQEGRTPPDGAGRGIAEIEVLAQALRAGAEAERKRHREQVLRVTAQQQEALLKESEQRLKRLLDQLFVFVSVLDLEGRVAECNAVPLELAGIRRDEVIGRPFWECHWWQHDRAAAQRVRDGVHAAARGDSQRFDILAAFAGGNLLTTDLQLAPLRDDAGRITHLVASGVDVEARVRALAARVEAEAALRRADRQKDEFLATLAHELRNPLAPIRTSVELIRRRESADPAIQRAREIIQRQVIHLTRLVDDLLDVSRITTGSIQLRKELLELGAVARGAADSVRPALDAAGLTLVQHIEPVTVDGDSTRLAQCIVNLLNNAIKFTPRGGRITLNVVRDAQAALVEVHDTGIGLQPENVDRIFELFVQEEPSGHGNTGLGIGLALTRKLMALHGGTVTAESAGPGQGSTFRIRLPAAGAAPGPDAPCVNPEHSVGSAHVLIVDDNRDAADVLSEMLAMSGFATTVAYEGEVALNAAARHRPDAVLLDIGLPGIDGYEVCRRIRGGAIAPQPVLIALTGWGQESDRRRASAAGFDAHLTKPVDPDRIVALLKELLLAQT